MIGETLSYFRITSKLGEGGMGEVYEATDTKLNRRVALKVLPEVFAGDSQRMARFQREAQVLASLNHPNIAAIHGLEEAEGKKALVMELVDGQDLSDRIKQGPLPLEEALQIAVQIAEALEAAHEKGIIHRDLKPANIKLSSDGRVKVLDFGLAKALEGDPQVQANLTQSPTISIAATQAGIILGTAGYMSPEQARGQQVDKRADIWAFGVILYEMLTGRVAFTGNTISDVMASVLKIDLDWSLLPKDTPAPILRLLKRCLRGEPEKRVHDIADCRIEVEEYLANPGAELSAQEIGGKQRTLSIQQKALIGGAAFIALLAALLLGWSLQPTPAPGQVVKGEFLLQGEDQVFLRIGSSAVLSPDGTKLVYTTGDPANGSSQLFYRSLDTVKAQPLQAAEGGYNPFFSPDGQWIGYVTVGELRKISVAGGTPLSLCDVSFSRGASWGENGQVAFAPNQSSGLQIVSSAGGPPQTLTELGEGELSHRWPQFLPGGRQLIFTSYASTDVNTATIEVLDLETKQRKVVHQGGTYGRYSQSGHLLFANNGTLFAAPLDLATMELSALPSPVIQGLSMNGDGGAQFSVSDNGTLSYLMGEAASVERELVRLNRDGTLSPVTEVKKHYRWLRLSTDSTRLAVEVFDERQFDIWIQDLGRDTQTRLTFDDGPDIGPVWSPDDEYVYFGSQRGSSWGVFRKRSDGAGKAERLTEDGSTVIPYGISPDGKFLAYHVNSGGRTSIWLLDLEEKGSPTQLSESSFDEYDAVFSPDGRWIAYESRESGRTEIYIRPFPGPGGKWQVSTIGGQMPRFSKDGRTLYYCGLDYKVWQVSVQIDGDSLKVGNPEQLLDKPDNLLEQEWDASGDGQHFYLVKRTASGADETGPNLVLLTFNWFEELNRMLTTTR
ncbi:MAG: serine/threonine-protein kinase [Acidobacteriota bacterium]|nr:MAG: serine/threonine-protein kinase [Acidobacteriota bacterium]